MVEYRSRRNISLWPVPSPPSSGCSAQRATTGIRRDTGQPVGLRRDRAEADFGALSDQLTPLRRARRPVVVEDVAADEMALVVEMTVVRGCGEHLQGLDMPEPLHRPFLRYRRESGVVPCRRHPWAEGAASAPITRCLLVCPYELLAHLTELGPLDSFIDDGDYRLPFPHQSDLGDAVVGILAGALDPTRVHSEKVPHRSEVRFG